MEEQKSSRVAWIIGAAVVVAVVIVVAYAFAMNREQGNDVTPVESSDSSTGAPSSDNSQGVNTESESDKKGKNVTISYTNEGFMPTAYTAKVGDDVTVKNNSSKQLQFSSDDHPTHTEEQELNLKVLAPGDEATFTPTKPGDWGFHDHLNSQFTGVLKVTE